MWERHSLNDPDLYGLNFVVVNLIDWVGGAYLSWGSFLSLDLCRYLLIVVLSLFFCFSSTDAPKVDSGPALTTAEC